MLTQPMKSDDDDDDDDDAPVELLLQKSKNDLKVCR